MKVGILKKARWEEINFTYLVIKAHIYNLVRKGLKPKKKKKSNLLKDEIPI